MAKNSSFEDNIKMYFNPKVARDFAALEQNEKNFQVADIVDKVIEREIAHLADPLFVAELGGGAHPDRYHKLFERLLREPQGHIDWLDISPQMLTLAKEYLQEDKFKDRLAVISFVNKEIILYLKDSTDDSIHLAIMKYTIDHISDLNELFRQLSFKLTPGGRLVATVGVLSPLLKSLSTNARFLYRGEEFPTNETRTLDEGESFTVKFFNVSGDPKSGYLEGAETIKFYHSPEKIKSLAKKYGFDFFLGDWKELLQSADKKEMDQNILVLRKK